MALVIWSTTSAGSLALSHPRMLEAIAITIRSKDPRVLSVQESRQTMYYTTTFHYCIAFGAQPFFCPSHLHGVWTLRDRNLFLQHMVPFTTMGSPAVPFRTATTTTLGRDTTGTRYNLRVGHFINLDLGGTRSRDLFVYI
ncbi:uncharacterized protein B0I36DRAFT_315632 [Microdochium trichocladiopsis]|uniref:Uncharacterized protein n=1 Tax=Microdochium trichocladiopsis TaxID=1682393 RepID=A0A9P9BUZ8_9PEZI|nr:uncharacterized protein B0I36DRAFT_315632 [Microdochium trichocladiopsis]KAH7038141.1 hypothetical protein B0I36DRAFT_315632 [Microdochium trichocladiopsis]